MRRFRKTVIFFGFIGWTIGQVFGQTSAHDIRFRSVAAEQGLSHPNVFCVLQDSKGLMWFGTKDGLDVYDGYSIRSYRVPPNRGNDRQQGLSSNYIQALFEDRQGFIWIGTYDGGLCRFDRRTERFIQYRHDPKKPESLGSNNVYSIFQDKKNRLWVGTFGGGLSRFYPEKQTFKTYTESPGNPEKLRNNSVFSIHEDQDGILWLGTFGGGLSAFDPEKEIVTTYLNDPNDPGSLPGNDIYALYEDRRGNLWIGTSGKGLVRFDRKTHRCKTYVHDSANPRSVSSNYILAIQEDALGMLWIATKGGGLCRFDPQKELFTTYRHNPANPNSLPRNDLNAFCLDKAGSLWIATDGGGVTRFETRLLAFNAFVNNDTSFVAHSVTSLFEDRHQRLWVGTFNDGLYCLDREKEQFVAFKNDPANPGSLSEDVVTALGEDKDGNLWVGTGDNGLCRFDPTTRTFKVYAHEPANPNSLSSNSIESIYQDRRQNLWIGTYGGGLCRFDSKSEQFVCYKNDPANPKSISGNAVKVIYEDHTGQFWIGNKETGLSVFDPRTETFTNYRHNPDNPNGLSSNSVTAIVETSDSRIWIGTFDGGISRFNPQTRQFTNLTTKDGLLDNSICGLLKDNKGNLWISTTRGLSHLNWATRQFRHFTVNEGLPSNEFVQWSYAASRSGELFFGGTNNFIAFQPEDVFNTPYVAPVYLSAFKLFDKKRAFSKPLPEITQIELAYDDNFFTFEFACLSYLDPERNQYAYQMEGFDKGWNYIGNRRFAPYTNLDAGEYVFRVKAADKNGVWNEAGASIRIVIHPAWYATWWFRLLMGLSVLGTGFSYYRYRIRIIENQKAVLEGLVAERTADLQEEKGKLEVAYDEISDQKENLEKAYDEINLQKDEIQRKNGHITSSITYAQRIQEAILPLKEEVSRALPESFILFKPRDIVSGDFYWFVQKGDILLIAAIDCTGHGVPGAFMSMIGNSLLNQLVNEQHITGPAEILHRMHQGVRQALKQDDAEDTTPDGMDIALCAIHPGRKTVEYAGANRPLWYVYQGELIELKATGGSVGGMLSEGEGFFTQHTVALEHPATFYLFTDGYADQFGGANQKKFMLKNFKQLLLDVQPMALKQQKETLGSTIENWKGDAPQTDDMLVIGFRV